MLPVDPRRPSRADALPSFVLLAGIVALALYCLGVGLALLSGRIAPTSAYLWMSGVPLALALWYLFGFMRQNDAILRDRGLLVSAAGWLMFAFCLVALYRAAQDAFRAGLPGSTAPSPLSWVFAALAIAAIAGGAWLSWQHWQSDNA